MTDIEFKTMTMPEGHVPSSLEAQGPGYWQKIGLDGKLGISPPTDRLESAIVHPQRCSLWMKLGLFFSSIGLKGYTYGCDRDSLNMTVEEGWAEAYVAWVIFMTLMAEAYTFPPPASHSLTTSPTLTAHLEQVENLGEEECKAFRSSLSDIQSCSWRMLRDWREASYQDSSLSESARSFIEAGGKLGLEHLNHSASLYQENLFALYDAEFNPALYKSGTSRGNDSNRHLAFDHVLAQKAAHLLIFNKNPADYTGANKLRYGKAFERAYNVCPWLPCSNTPLQDPTQLPHFLWDRNERRTVKVFELLGKALDISYTCISHTWGRWQKASAPVHVAGVDGWLIPLKSDKGTPKSCPIDGLVY